MGRVFPEGFVSCRISPNLLQLLPTYQGHEIDLLKLLIMLLQPFVALRPRHLPSRLQTHPTGRAIGVIALHYGQGLSARVWCQAEHVCSEAGVL
jgi:hypothetical protein